MKIKLSQLEKALSSEGFMVDTKHQASQIQSSAIQSSAIQSSAIQSSSAQMD